MRLGSGLGSAASGAERLWRGAPGGVSSGNFDPAARFDAEAAYGLDVPRGLLTPYTGVAVTGAGETWRAGARWKLKSAIEVSLEARHRESAERRT